MWHDMLTFAIGVYVGGVIAFVIAFIDSYCPGVHTREDAIISFLTILVWPVWFALYSSYLVVLAIVKACRLARFGRRG